MRGEIELQERTCRRGEITALIVGWFAVLVHLLHDGEGKEMDEFPSFTPEHHIYDVF